MSPLPPPPQTYRYYDSSSGAPLVRFGAGRSYSTFATACDGGFAYPGADEIAVRCNITNAPGSPAGDQVLQVYHRASADVVARVAGAHPVPLSSLVAFDRFSLAAGATLAGADFALRASEALALTDATGASILYQGLHYLDVFDGMLNVTTIAIEVPGSGGGVAARVIKRPPPPPSGV